MSLFSSTRSAADADATRQALRLFLTSLLLSLGLGALVLALIGPLALNARMPWYLSRASGTVAYLLLAGSTVWGLLLSSKLVKDVVPAVLSLAMHNALAWLAISLTAVHGLALLFDSYFTFTPANLVIPFVGPYRPGWVGLGIVGLYLMLVTSLSFYVRRGIGQKRWRQLHFLTFGAFVLVTLHGMMAGTDSGNPGMQAVYWGSGLLVLFLTNYRIVGSRLGERGSRARP